MAVKVKKNLPKSVSIRELFTGPDSEEEYGRFMAEKAKALYRKYPSNYAEETIARAKFQNKLLPKADFDGPTPPLHPVYPGPYHWSPKDVQVLQSAITAVIRLLDERRTTNRVGQPTPEEIELTNETVNDGTDGAYWAEQLQRWERGRLKFCKPRSTQSKQNKKKESEQEVISLLRQYETGIKPG